MSVVSIRTESPSSRFRYPSIISTGSPYENILPFLVLLISGACAPFDDELTTFVLVRHAEKANDGTDDPHLSGEGNARAKRLAYMFKDTPVAAVYSPDFKRTRQTAAPLAHVHDTDIENYTPYKPDVIEGMLNNHKGKTVFISGHSNDIPRIANLLLGKKQFDDYSESEYGTVRIVSLRQIGEGSVLRLNY